MPISYVGLNAAAANSVSLPTFAAGDLAIVHAFRDGSTTPPSLPAGWIDISSGGANTCSQRIGYRVLVGGDTSTSTWTNATEIQVMVLRGQHASSPIGSSSGDTTNNSNFIDYISMDMVDTGGTSWIVGFAAHRNATNVNVPGAIGFESGQSMIRRSGSVGTLGAHTAENVSVWEWTGYDIAVNSSSGAWRSYTIEVRADRTIPNLDTVIGHID